MQYPKKFLLQWKKNFHQKSLNSISKWSTNGWISSFRNTPTFITMPHQFSPYLHIFTSIGELGAHFIPITDIHFMVGLLSLDDNSPSVKILEKIRDFHWR
jgi:hypothetical protein